MGEGVNTRLKCLVADVEARPRIPNLWVMVTMQGSQFTAESVTAYEECIKCALETSSWYNDDGVTVLLQTFTDITSPIYEEMDVKMEDAVEVESTDTREYRRINEATITVTMGNMGMGTAQLHAAGNPVQCPKQQSPELRQVLVGHPMEEGITPICRILHLQSSVNSDNKDNCFSCFSKDATAAAGKSGGEKQTVQIQSKQPLRTTYIVMTPPKDSVQSEFAKIGIAAHDAVGQLGTRVHGRHLVVGGCASARPWEQCQDSSAMAAGGL
jgi:hypothetical protein